MAAVTKIDSNVTGLRYSEETALKTADPSAVWRALEPNSYGDFGGQTTLVPREPIDPSRQRRKGVITDLDAQAGWNTDVTLTNLRDLGQGFFFADRRDKVLADSAVEPFTDIDTTADEYVRGAGSYITDGWLVGALAFGADFEDAGNDGLKRVTSVTATALGVAEDLIDNAAPAAVGTLTEVGFQFAAGDADIDDSGTLPRLTTTTKDCTELGLIPGEFIFIGGDTGGAAGNQFLTAANNGFARVRQVAAGFIEFDKTAGTMVTEASTAETVQIFFGSVIKNETGSLVKRRSYQLERQLGAPDDALPAEIQAQYLTGSIPNELTITAAAASKLEADLTFVALDDEQIDGPTSLKAGTRPALVSDDALNTSSDISKIKLAVIDPLDANPTALFGFATDLTVTINNNVTPDKALGVLGGFEATAGNFEVSGDIEAYFSAVAAITAVRDNSDVTLEVHYVKSNAGVSMDMPLIALGDARLNVEKDEPIKIPLTNDAASGSKIDPTLDHTLLFVFWTYLPTAADT